MKKDKKTTSEKSIYNEIKDHSFRLNCNDVLSILNYEREIVRSFDKIENLKITIQLHFKEDSKSKKISAEFEALIEECKIQNRKTVIKDKKIKLKDAIPKRFFIMQGNEKDIRLIHFSHFPLWELIYDDDLKNTASNIILKDNTLVESDDISKFF